MNIALPEEMYEKVRKMSMLQHLTPNEFFKISGLRAYNQATDENVDPFDYVKNSSRKRTVDQNRMEGLMDEYHLKKLEIMAREKNMTPRQCLEALIAAGVTDRTVYLTSDSENVTVEIHELKEFCKGCMYIMLQNQRRMKLMLESIENLDNIKNNPYYEKNVINSFKAHLAKGMEALGSLRICINRFFKKNFSNAKLH